LSLPGGTSKGWLGLQMQSNNLQMQNEAPEFAFANLQARIVTAHVRWAKQVWAKQVWTLQQVVDVLQQLSECPHCKNERVKCRRSAFIK
jgi:hypothetical protein